ncbi:MAG TPA: TolC family protein [Acidobacteriota bacterium]|nr:TolC family protein [Acidobacteriota bacterium]
MLSLTLTFRRLSAATLSALLLGGSSLPALAQNPNPTPESLVAVNTPTDGIVRTQAPATSTSTQDATSSAKQEPKAVDTLPTERVGVDQSKVLRLALHDAILMALNSNIDIEVERGNVQIAQYDMDGSRGAYDPLLSSQFNFNSSVTPETRIFVGAQGGSVASKQLDYNAAFRQALTTGGNYQISFINSRQETNAQSQGLNPQYFSELRFQFTQPLMRNYRSSQNERLIKINKKQLTLSDSAFRQRVITTISRVQAAYWDLVFAIRNSQISREAVELADVTLRNNLRQVEVGTLAPIEIVSARADLESRKDTAISALQQVTIAENALKALILGDPLADQWNAVIEPTEKVEFTAIDITLDDAIKSALQNRPEVEQIKLRQELKNVDLQFFRNQEKPQVDFVASYILSGLAGQTSLPVVDSRSMSPQSAANQLQSSIYNFNQQLGQPSLINPVTRQTQGGIPSRFVGGYGTALSNVFSFDFRSYNLGVNFSFPLRNRTAKANIGRTLAENRQLQAQERQTVQTIQAEVRNAVQAVLSARQRYEAARAARIAAKEQLEGEQKKYEAGISNNFFVLDRQTRFSNAQGQEIRALTDYNKSISELQRVTSTTLSVNNIQVTSNPDQAPNQPAGTTDSPSRTND